MTDANWMTWWNPTDAEVQHCTLCLCVESHSKLVFACVLEWSSACWSESGKSSIHQPQLHCAARHDRRKAALKHRGSHTYTPIPFIKLVSVLVSLCCCCCYLSWWLWAVPLAISLSSLSSVHVRKLSLFFNEFCADLLALLSPSSSSLAFFSLPRYLEEDESAKGKWRERAEHDGMFVLLLTDTIVTVKKECKENKEGTNKRWK